MTVGSLRGFDRPPLHVELLAEGEARQMLGDDFAQAGQRRRLSIARLVAAPRPIWLLDEPTSALDTPSQKKLAELMSGHLSGGGMIVAAAHGPIGLERARELKLGLA